MQVRRWGAERRRWSRLRQAGSRLALGLVILTIVVGLAPTPAAATMARNVVSRSTAAAPPAEGPAPAPAGWPAFLIGASYEGPADRAWRGDYWAWWADDLF